MKSRLLGIALAALLAGACAAKQEVKPVEEAPPQAELKLPEVGEPKEPAVEKKAEEPVAAEKKAEERYIMLNFENADIETVVSTVGEMLKINYILAPGISGKITIQSHSKIPLSELFSTFQTVLEMNGLTAMKVGSFYRIVPIDTAKQQPLPVAAGKTPDLPADSGFITQEIPLDYVKANDVANLLRNLLPKGTDIVVYEPSNMLIVTAAPSGIVKFLKLLEAIDIPPSDRDAVKTFVYNVENGEAKKLVEILKSIYATKKTTGAPVKAVTPAPTPAAAQAAAGRAAPRAAQPAAGTGATVQEGLAGEIEGDVVIDAYEDINAIIIKASPRAYLSLLETIKKLDVQPKQVLIEVLIAEITLDKTTELGIEWLLKTSIHVNGRDFDVVGGSGSLPFNTETNSFESVLTSESTPTNYFANILDPSRFNVLINAAATTDRINVLASPHILALDNKEAKIEIGDEVPVATSITTPTDTTSTTTTSSVQFKSVGTILTVTPHINEKKQVTLKLTQEVSEIGSTVKIGDQDFTGFKTRKANTTAIVQDGHTLVIGGIISERAQKSRGGLPLLSDIPVLGYLFGSTTDSTSKKELILMVTPHVIANRDEADELSRELRDRVKGIREKLDNKKADEAKGQGEENK